MKESHVYYTSSVERVRTVVDGFLSQRRHEIWTVIQKRIGAMTGLPDDQVRPDSGLIDELGLDSIDVIELQIALGTYFGVIIHINSLHGLVQLDGGADIERLLSEADLERIHTLLPELSDRINSDCRAQDIPSLFTAETLVRLVAWSVAERDEVETA